MSANTFLRVLVIAAMGALAGCGEARIPVYPVSGKVTFNGQVPSGAQVVLHPVSGTLPADIAATGTVKDDGSFKIGVYDAGDGTPPGDYIATVEWFKVVADPTGGSVGRGPNVLPPKYSRKDTSPIRVSVKESPLEVPPIVITR